MRVTILDDWCDTLRALPSFALLDGHEVDIVTAHLGEDGLAERCRDTQALILFRERTALPASLVARLAKLRLVSLRGATPHVDLEACAARGVSVCALPPASSPPHATAELTMALMLAGLRRLPQNAAALKAGRWQEGVGRQLHGRRVGVWSYGRLGREVARLSLAFGARVEVHGSAAAMDAARADGVRTEPDRRAFFAGSDIVSLHLRLSGRTRAIVTPELLAAMRPDAMLVNTSRAGLVAPGALGAALAAGRPGSAALDVFDTEPLTDPDHPLLTHPNVVATPHLGFVTLEELEAQFADVFAQVNAFAEGRPVNVVTR